MKITIQKYLKPLNTDLIDNLFSGNMYINSPANTDEIIFEKHLIDAIPSFTEEFYKEDDFEALKDGDFDFKFSMGTNEKSRLGWTIYQFFNYVEPTISGREKYFVLCEISSVRKYSGTLDIGSLVANEAEGTVEFKTISIGKEAVEWMKIVKLQGMNTAFGDPIWETDYMPNWHFKDTGIFLIYNTFLDLPPRVGGVEIRVRAQNQASMFDGGLNRGYSVWAGLRSFLIGWFIKMKIEFSHFDSNKRPYFKLNLFWRSKGLNTIPPITKYKENIKSLEVTENKWVFIPYTQFVESISDIDYYTGILFSRNAVYYNDPAIGRIDGTDTRFGFNQTKNIFQFLRNNGVQGEIPAEKVLKINMGFHAQKAEIWVPQTGEGLISYYVNMSYCRIVSVYFYILMGVIKQEAFGLIESIKRKRFLDVKCPDELALKAGTRMLIAGKNYTCERVTEYNTFTKDMSTEWIEG